MERTTTSPVLDAHPHLQIDPVVMPQPLGIGIALCLHTKRGKQGALGVVFMGQRRAERAKIPSPMDWAT